MAGLEASSQRPCQLFGDVTSTRMGRVNVGDRLVGDEHVAAAVAVDITSETRGLVVGRRQRHTVGDVAVLGWKRRIG